MGALSAGERAGVRGLGGGRASRDRLIETTNAAGHVSTVAFDARHGVVRATVDPNWVESRSFIDGFGRPRITESDYGDRTELTYGRGTTAGIYTIAAVSNVDGRANVTLDRLGRVRTATVRHSFRDGITETEYDARGRVVSQSEPHTLGARPLITRVRYDGLDRIRTITRPEADDVTTYRYEPNVSVRTDPARNEWRTERDLRGLVAASIEPDPAAGPLGGRTSYRYCASGEIRSVTDTVGNATDVGYDLLGRRTSLDDPDTGHETFAYTAWDEIERTVDGAGRVSQTVHDELGRVTDRFDEADGSHFRWEYDSALGPTGRRVLGMLSEEESGDGVKDRYEFDELHRPIRVTRSVGGHVLTIGQGYDAEGRLDEVSYPSLTSAGRLRIGYTYHPASGELIEVDDKDTGVSYWRLLTQDARGMPLAESVGPLQRVSRYTATGRLEDVRASEGSADLQRLHYEYDPRGLVSSRFDFLTGGSDSYVHDAVGRLTDRFGASNETYDYDELGNLLTSHDATLTYPGLGAARPHGATHLSTDEGEDSLISYDDVGNVESMGDLSIAYNQLNLPRNAHDSDESLTFEYDASGSRARKLSSSGSTVYFGAYERWQDGLTLFERTMVMTPTGPVAQIEAAAGIGEMVQIRWLLTERQGSIDTSYVQGEEAEHFTYDSFGAVLGPDGLPSRAGPSGDLTHGYTGHEHDSEIGLINMQGRMYHPRLRRFLSADPLSNGVGQGLNRYSYVRNNPLNLIDPSGFDPLNGDMGDHWMPGDLEAERRLRGDCGPNGNTCEGGGNGVSPSDGGSERTSAEVIADASGVNENGPTGATVAPGDDIVVAALAGAVTGAATGAAFGYMGGVVTGALLAAGPVGWVVLGVGSAALLGLAAYEIYTHREAISGTAERIVTGTGTADDYYNATSLLGSFLGGGRTFGRGMRDGARYGPATRRFLEGELRNLADLLANEGGSVGPGARAAGATARLLPSSAGASWGATVYRHGGLMTGIEHIMYRHGANSVFAGVGRYMAGTTARNVVNYVAEALRFGTVARTGPAAFTFEYNLGRVIGTDMYGNAASSIRVFVLDGIIQTAFPF